MTYDPSSRSKLTPRSGHLFAGDTLFDALARTVCEADCLPRKELFEAWEVAKRVRRRTRGGRVVDLAAGHGLLAYALLLLDNRLEEGLCVDRRKPDSFAKLAAALEARWPRLAGKVSYVEGRLEEVVLRESDLVVSVHACGGLTDRVLALAAAVNARVAVLPCCHSHKKLDQGGLDGWLDRDVAIDVVRAMRLREKGYSVWTGTIPETITPENRLLIATPGG